MCETAAVETGHRDRNLARDERLVTPAALALVLDGLDAQRYPRPIRCFAARVAGHGLDPIYGR